MGYQARDDIDVGERALDAPGVGKNRKDYLFSIKELFMPVFPFKGVWPTIAEDVFIAPGAMIIGNVTIHEGASIWYNTVLRGDSAPIVIGRGTNIQDNCTLHVDGDAPLTIGE